MPEGITGAVWAFCWGLAAASGVLGGTILALIARLRHRAIAAIMSLGAGVLVSAASVSIGWRSRRSSSLARSLQQAESLSVPPVQHRERSSRDREGSKALRGMQAAALGSEGTRQRQVDCARHRA